MKKLRVVNEVISIAVVAIAVLFVMCFALLYFSEAQFPTALMSSGIVAIISALIGVTLTAIAVSFQLKKQSEAEVEKEKAVKMYKQKTRMFSEFTSTMWKMANDVESDDAELSKSYNELRLMCFDKLVFFLKKAETEQLAKIIEEIDTTKPMDYNLISFCEITNILQCSLENKIDNTSSLSRLYNAFDKKDIEAVETKRGGTGADSAHITFWHFIMLGDQQIKAFKNNHWILSLIEYDEEWRTRLIRKVKPNDVIFLFKRGGAGYIGAFRALDPPSKILKQGEIYSDAEYAKFDIYGGMGDDASWASNIRVEPIAYNYEGVGYYTLRRRTIERINDTATVGFLLEKFSGIHLDESRLAGKGKLDGETPVKLNEDYFSKIVCGRNLDELH
jgi:hypothetical protein